MISSLPGKALRMLVEACRAIQHVFLKPSLVNSKDANLFSIYQFTNCFTLKTSDYDVTFDFSVDLASLGMSFKKRNVIMT